MALRLLGRSRARRVLGVTSLATMVIAVMACDPGHTFVITNGTDKDIEWFWDRDWEHGQGNLLGSKMEHNPSLLYINGDGGDPERHLFQAFDLEGNLICASNRTEQEWEDQNWTIYIVEADECGKPP